MITAILSASVTAYVTGITETKPLQEQLDDQKQKTTIMNQTLHAMQQSLERKSLISVKILPYVGFPSDKFVGFKYVLGPGNHYTRETSVSNTSLNLIANQNYTFDIVITNIGGDTAVLNYYLVEKVQKTDRTGSINQGSQDINRILRSNSDPLIIKYNFTADKTYAPNGTLYFTVSYDNGAAESGAIPYVYSSR